MTNRDLHDRLTDLLGLDHPPVAITFRADDSGTAPRFGEPMSEPTSDGRSGRAAASCVFWVHGQTETFSTRPEDHGNCSVGRFTHGFVEPAEILDKDDVATLLEVGWVTMSAFAGVAALPSTPEAITYGPLSDSVGQPDVVLLRLNPRQMMNVADAATVEFSGKPQCQILPRAAGGTIAASMGCALSRERIGMADDELTCAIPATRLGELIDSLADVRHADSAVVSYAATDSDRFRAHLG